MIGALIARELTISFRRGTVHLLALGQMLAALALVAGAVAARTVPARQAGRSPRLEVEQRETG